MKKKEILFGIVIILAMLFIGCEQPVSLNNDIESEQPVTQDNEYSVTFEPNGGSGEMDIQKIISGNSANLTANTFKRTGYTFTGWSTTADRSAEYINKASYTIGDKNVTLYAIWTVNVLFTITYNGNTNDGGSTAKQIVSEAVNYNERYQLNQNGFSKTGFTFTGWSKTKDAQHVFYEVDGERASIPSRSYEDLTFYATWVPSDIKHTLTFNGNKNTGGSTYSQTIIEGICTKLKKNEFTRFGYRFIGWQTQENDRHNIDYQEDSNYFMGDSDKDLYAVWDKIPRGYYKIIYNGNTNDGGETAFQSRLSETTSKLTPNGFTKTGYTFAGWSTTINGSVEYTDNSEFTVGYEETTLYAIWIESSADSHTITFNGNGDSSGSTASLNLNESLSAPLTANGFTKTGYSFTGWSSSANGLVEYGNEASYKMGNSNITLYAIWKVNNYIITFNGNNNDGGSTTSQVIQYNESDDLNFNGFTKTGYSFAGWSTTSDGSIEYTDETSYTMGNCNITLYAIWTINNYIITFDGNKNDGGSTTSQVVQYKKSEELNSNGFIKTGFSFAGWSTTSDGSIEYTDETSYTMGNRNITLYAKWSPEIGSSYAGGIVFYVDETGEHGLVCANVDQSSGIQWSLIYDAEIGCDDKSVGAGELNTKKIVSNQGDGKYAAKLCVDYSIVIDGILYDDWFLPSEDELDLIYQNLYTYGFGNFSSSVYWSSSEVDSQGYFWNASVNNFFDGYESVSYKKNPNAVRAIRSF